MVSSIFRNAALVLAWLGPEENHSTEVLEILEQLAREIESHSDSPTEIFSKPAPQALLDKLGKVPSDESVFSLAWERREEFCHLFRDRPFWSRAWIFQELLLAPWILFICGSVGFGLSDIGKIVTWIDEVQVNAKPADVEWGPWLILRDDLAKGLRFSMRKACFLSEIFLPSDPEDIERSKTSYELAWIAATQSILLRAKDPREKVYSLLGIVDTGMKANYSKTIEAIYTEFATIFFGYVPLDEWLSITGVGLGPRILQVPTWVIDWDSIHRLDFPTIAHEAFYSANTGVVNPSHRAEIKGQMLKVFGTSCGEINAVAPFPGTVFENAAEAFQFDMTVRHNKKNRFDLLVQPGIPRAQASLRLCLDDRDISRKHPFKLSKQSACHYLILLQSSPDHARYSYSTGGIITGSLGEALSRAAFDLIGPSLENDFQFASDHILASLGEDYILSEMLAFGDLFGDHFGTARHFFTDKGHLGYGAKGILEGDIVCVLQGSRVPVLLRKIEDYYHFVSTCFVLGLMGGEAAQMLERGEVFMQQFNVR